MGDGFVLEDTLDAYGNETKLFDLTGLPKNADVAEINGYPVEGYRRHRTENGRMPHFRVVPI